MMVCYARKEIAFDQWKRSGYRDVAAWERYIYWFEVCQSNLNP